jgi:hypothetical protein
MIHSNGMLLPPGSYTVKLSIGTWSQTQPFALLIDPRTAAEGVTAADLREHFDFVLKSQALNASFSDLSRRTTEARTRLRGATGAAADTAAKVNKVALAIFGPDEGIRYGVPGLRTHMGTFTGMTPAAADMKVGREAIKRHAELKKIVDDLTLELDRALGARRPAGG